MESAVDIVGSLEASEELGVSRATLSRWIDAGRITPIRKLPGLAGGYIFHRAEVRRAAAEKTLREAERAAEQQSIEAAREARQAARDARVA
jgi:predicted site-specific integrase-resolvase